MSATDTSYEAWSLTRTKSQVIHFPFFQGGEEVGAIGDYALFKFWGRCSKRKKTSAEKTRVSFGFFSLMSIVGGLR